MWHPRSVAEPILLDYGTNNVWYVYVHIYDKYFDILNAVYWKCNRFILFLYGVNALYFEMQFQMERLWKEYISHSLSVTFFSIMCVNILFNFFLFKHTCLRNYKNIILVQSYPFSAGIISHINSLLICIHILESVYTVWNKNCFYT